MAIRIMDDGTRISLGWFSHPLPFDILWCRALPASRLPGNLMFKCNSLFVLVLSGMSAAFGQVTLNTTPTRTVGHAKPEGNANLPNYNPNLVEGRELDGPVG